MDEIVACTVACYEFRSYMELYTAAASSNVDVVAE